MRLKIEDMVMFAKVADKLSFNKAADELNIPLSTLSRRITALEKTLNVPLFERSTRQIALTDAGKEIITYCQDIVRKKNDLEDFIEANYHQNSGELTIVASHAAASLLSKNFMPRFLKNHPNITITLKSSSDAYDDIGGDILITSILPKNESLVATKIGTLTRSFFASPDYLKKYGTPTSLHDLQHHKLLCVGNAFHPCLSNYYKQLCLDDLQIQPSNLNLKFFDIFQAIEAAICGHGIVWTSKFVVERKVIPGTLQMLFDESLNIEVPSYAVYKQRFNQPQKIVSFVSELKLFISENSKP